MSSKSEPIVISSGEEDKNEVVFVKETGAEKKACGISDKKESGFRLNRSKLKSLKSRNERKKVRSHTQCKLTENQAHGTLNKSSPSKYLQNDKTTLKELEAVVKIEPFVESPICSSKLGKSSKLKDDENVKTSRMMKTSKTVCLSPHKSPPTQKHLLQYLQSSPKSKGLMMDIKFDKMSLSVKAPSSSPSPNTTPVKIQSKLETWVTPTKKMKKQGSLTPSRNVNAKRNELVWPPQHVILNPEEFIKSLYKNQQDFPVTLKYLIESLQDEELFLSVVKTIDRFMSTDFAPSSEIIWYLVNDVLSCSSDPVLTNMTYSLLNDILARYPTKCMEMKITWKDIKRHFLPDKADSDEKKKPSNKLVRSFLLSVLSVEVKATALKSRDTRLKRCFAADFDLRHVKDVIPHLKECLQNHTATPNAAFQSCEFSSECISAEEQDLPRPGVITCGLQLYENLLKLFMIASSNKEYVAIRLANELTYLYIDLANFEQKVLLLQSITSHRVRIHVIDVLLMNYCVLLPEAMEGQNHVCVRRIFLQDFYRQPSSKSDECGHSVEDVEEYITLLAYLLQSYVVTHNPILHGYHNDYSLCYHDGIREFSQEDLSYLEDLKFHVSRLRTRCNRFLMEGQHLSIRTNLLLQMMEMRI